MVAGLHSNVNLAAQFSTGGGVEDDGVAVGVAHVFWWDGAAVDHHRHVGGVPPWVVGWRGGGDLLGWGAYGWCLAGMWMMGYILSA